MARTADQYGPTGVGDQPRYAIDDDPRRILRIPVGGLKDRQFYPVLGLAGGSPDTLNGSLAAGFTNVGLRNVLVTPSGAFAYAGPGEYAGNTVSLVFGDGVYDQMLTEYSGRIITLDFPDGVIDRVVFNNGSMVYRQTTNANFGASRELWPASQMPGTVDTVTNGSAAIVGLATTWSTAALDGAGTAYAYKPSKDLLQPGDFIIIVQGAKNYRHRIVTITDPTHMTIYPVWQGTSAGPGAGLAYSILRDGYGSYSRVVPILNTTNNHWYLYYAGNWFARGAPYGTIECVEFSSNFATFAHYTCPQTSAPLDVQAVDVALYKGYLLYGAGTSVSWSVVGFPTSFTTGFGATDFPAGNTTVVQLDDEFVAFGNLGEELIALFRKSVWRIVPTGVAPPTGSEFNFFKIPEVLGASTDTQFALGTGTFLRQRPCKSARNAIYYNSAEGLTRLSGSGVEKVSYDVDVLSVNLPASQSCSQVTYEPMTDSVFWHSGKEHGLALCYPTKAWSLIDLGGSTGWSGAPANDVNIIRFLTGDIGTSRYFATRSFTMGYWDWTDNKIKFINQETGGIGNFLTTAAPVLGMWVWTTPVLSLGDAPESFRVGGMAFEGMNASGSSVTVQCWGGNNPLALKDRGKVLLVGPTQATRLRFGKKMDDPYVAFTIYGTLCGRVESLVLYPVQVPPSMG